MAFSRGFGVSGSLIEFALAIVNIAGLDVGCDIDWLIRHGGRDDIAELIVSTAVEFSTHDSVAAAMVEMKKNRAVLIAVEDELYRRLAPHVPYSG